MRRRCGDEGKALLLGIKWEIWLILARKFAPPRDSSQSEVLVIHKHNQPTWSKRPPPLVLLHLVTTQGAISSGTLEIGLGDFGGFDEIEHLE